MVQPNPNLPKTTTGNIDIFADWHPTVVDPNTNDGAVIVLRGEVTPGTDGLTRVFGAQQDDLIVFDRTLLGGQTRAFGSATPPPLRAYSPAADGSDTLVVYLIPTMPVEGTTLTLDGQGGADDYVVWAHGSQAGDVHYVVNLFDSGAPGDGADTAEVYGADSAANGIDPATGLPYATDDLFLLRGTSYVPGESSARPSLYCGSTSDAPCSQHPAYVAVVHPSQPTPPLPALSADDLAALARTNDYAGVTERINYDGALNGRLAVMSRGGNDLFAVDDTAAIATLDAGDGDDTVLVGQVYGTRRDATFSGLDPPDFFSTIATTRGYLSNGASAPLLAQGGAGDDTFVIGGSQATLRLEGDAGDDTFTIAAYALAQTGRGGIESTGPLFAGTVTIDSAVSTDHPGVGQLHRRRVRGRADADRPWGRSGQRHRRDRLRHLRRHHDDHRTGAEPQHRAAARDERDLRRLPRGRTAGPLRPRGRLRPDPRGLGRVAHRRWQLRRRRLRDRPGRRPARRRRQRQLGRCALRRRRRQRRPPACSTPS